MVDTGPSEASVLKAQRQGKASFVFAVSSTARQLQHGLPEVRTALHKRLKYPPHPGCEDNVQQDANHGLVRF